MAQTICFVMYHNDLHIWSTILSYPDDLSKVFLQLYILNTISMINNHTEFLVHLLDLKKVPNLLKSFILRTVQKHISAFSGQNYTGLHLNLLSK